MSTTLTLISQPAISQLEQPTAMSPLTTPTKPISADDHGEVPHDRRAARPLLLHQSTRRQRVVSQRVVDPALASESRDMTSPAASEEPSVVETVVPVVEGYLRDFGLRDASLIASHARLIVGRAMLMQDNTTHTDAVLTHALQMTFSRRAEWEALAHKSADRLWNGAMIVPEENRVPMPSHQVVPLGRQLGRHQRTVAPASS